MFAVQHEDAIDFDPVLRARDAPNWIDDSVPDDVLQHMNLPESLLQRARGPLRRLLLRRWIGGLDPRGIVRKMHAAGGPRDLAIQQPKVAAADALAFVAPFISSASPRSSRAGSSSICPRAFADARRTP